MFKNIAVKIYNIVSIVFLSGVWLIGAIIVTVIYFRIFGKIYEVFSKLEFVPTIIIILCVICFLKTFILEKK